MTNNKQQKKVKAHLKTITVCLLIIGLVYCISTYPVLTLKIIAGIFSAIFFYASVFAFVNSTSAGDD
jgi:hypothetical protein